MYTPRLKSERLMIVLAAMFGDSKTGLPKKLKT